MKKVIKISENNLRRIINESVKRVLSEIEININTNLVQQAKNTISSYGGYLEVNENDIDELQIYNGDLDGESHGIVSIDKNGVEMDDGDFYSYNELSPDDLRMIIDYINWKLNV